MEHNMYCSLFQLFYNFHRTEMRSNLHTNDGPGCSHATNFSIRMDRGDDEKSLCIDSLSSR